MTTSKTTTKTSSSIDMTNFNEYFHDKASLFEEHRYVPSIDKDVYCKIYIGQTDKCITFASRARFFYTDLFVSHNTVELWCDPINMSGPQIIAFIWSYLSNRRSNTFLPEHLNELITNINIDQVTELAQSVHYIVADKSMLRGIIVDLDSMLPKRFREIASDKKYVPRDADFGMYGRNIDNYLGCIKQMGDSPASNILADIIKDAFNKRYSIWLDLSRTSTWSLI